MSKFVIVYLGGNRPPTELEGKQHMDNYLAWIASMGERVISPANPFKDTHVVNADRTVSTGSAIAMSGYTIIEADSIEQALAVAKDCPFLEIGGSLEVSELVAMPQMS